MKNKRKMKKIIKIMIGGIFILLVVLLGFLFYHPMFIKSETITLDVNEKYDYKDNIRFIFMGDKEDVKIDKKIDTSKIQDYTVEYSYKNKKQTVTISVKDLSGPKLKLKDYSTDQVEEVKPETFVESCKDVSKYTLDMSMEEEEKGKFTVTITAKDEYDNETVKTCKLTRKEDKTPPTIENFVENVTVMQGDFIDYEDVQIKDDFDPKPKLEIQGSVDFGVPGTYQVTYMITDRSQNIGCYDKTIIVQKNDESAMKVVYLTFDDGPSYNTPEVLDILDKYNVKATFFVTGNGQQYNDNIKRAYDAGHAIGLHTYSHDYATVYASEKAYFDDLNAVGNMVKGIIGYVPDIIRFPGGSSNTVSANYSDGIMTKLSKEVIKRGYQYYDWNVSSGDASGMNVDTDSIIEQATMGSGDKIMILFHDTYGKETTVEALPKVIKYYKKQGYVFMPITKGVSYTCHHGINN